jgi:release factor glutamine methyltransferase
MDGQVMLAQAMHQEKAWLLAHPESSLTRCQAETFTGMLARVRGGEPLPYVLGWWEFYGRRFHLNRSVLIPRPETELLVEEALRFLRGAATELRILDVGTGSGCVAVTLACEVQAATVIATDISREVLQVAQRNARQHGVSGRVHFVQADLVRPLAGSFDLLCANLPYIPTALLGELPVGRNEPGLALDGGSDGLAPLRRLLGELRRIVRPGGRALMEIGDGQGRLALAAAREALGGVRILVRKDLAGQERLLVVGEGEAPRK